MYVRDIVTGRTFLASRADGGGGADAGDNAGDVALSGDGNRVAFGTEATNLGDGDSLPNYDIHVRDLAAGTTMLATGGAGGAPGDGYNYQPALDGDGTHVAFVSRSTNLGDGDADSIDDVHVRDLAAGTTRLVSAAPGGPKADLGTSEPTISSDGAVVAFASSAPALVPDGKRHVLVRDFRRDTLEIADRADGPGGALADLHADEPSISGDGRWVTWTSPATNLVAGVPANVEQAYVRDIEGHTTRLVSRAGGAAGAPLALSAHNPALSADGACAVFVTRTPLAPGAGTDFAQVYMRALGPGCVPALPAGGGGPGGGEARDLTAPVLSKVSLKRKRFAVGRKRGTVLRFGLSEPAQVKVRVRRARGSLVRAKGAGAGRLRFSGRLGGRALRAGPPPDGRHGDRRRRQPLAARDPALQDRARPLALSCGSRSACRPA